MEKDKIPAGGYSAMTDYPEDVYTEPSDFDVHTLKNLGPLTGLAGIWQGTRSLDVNPKAEGPEEQVFVERIELQPIDPQTNGPQLFYGLRYHTHIVKPGEVETYHDQVGYWLWEPASYVAGEIDGRHAAAPYLALDGVTVGEGCGETLEVARKSLLPVSRRSV